MTRDEMRAAFPGVARIVDAHTAVAIADHPSFRPAWIRLTENGTTVEHGRRVPDRVVPDFPGKHMPQWGMEGFGTF